MTLQQQLEQYDIKAGDLIEFTDGEIWRWVPGIYSLQCLRGAKSNYYSVNLEEASAPNDKTIKRVMRTDWGIKDVGSCYPYFELTELKPKARKKLVTIELSEGNTVKVGDYVITEGKEVNFCGKVVEVREK